MESIQELSDPLWNNPSWRRLFPLSNPHAILTSLFAVNVGRSYLVTMTNTITGQPLLKPGHWVPSKFNLRGFQVLRENAPPFEGCFAPSRAHAVQPVYRLNPAFGVWRLVNPAADLLVTS